MEPKKLLDLSYLFQISPSPEGLYLYLAILFGALFLFCLVIIYLYKSELVPYKKLRGSLTRFSLTISLIGLSLIFFRWQKIDYLGSRIMLVFLFVFALIWLISIGYFRFFIIPKEIKKIKKKQKFEKYLPREKSRGLPKTRSC